MIDYSARVCPVKLKSVVRYLCKDPGVLELCIAIYCQGRRLIDDPILRQGFYEPLFTHRDDMRRVVDLVIQNGLTDQRGRRYTVYPLHNPGLAERFIRYY